MAVNNASNPQNSGSFVPTTNVWDVSEIYSIEKIDPKLQELLVRLYQNLNLMSLTLNTKESGFYVLNQFVDGNVWFPNPTLNSNSSTTPALRQEYIKVIYYTTPLPNAGSTAGTVPIPHGITITAATTFTQIYATANDTTGNNYIPIPYASPTLANNIEIKVDATNVTIITGSNRTNFTQTYIVLRYLQN
jgi:hypothetical protein